MLVDQLIYKEQSFDEPISDTLSVSLNILYKWENHEDMLINSYINILKGYINIEESEIKQIRENIEDYFEIVYSNLLSVDPDIRYVKIEMNFYEMQSIYGIDLLEIEKLQEDILSEFKSNLQTLSIWKFRDDIQLWAYIELYQQIYKIEMRLREVISFIFLYRYYSIEHNSNEYEDFLKYNDIVPQFKKDEKITDLKKSNENVFYRISFSSYIKLLELKKIDHNQIFLSLNESFDFEDWRDEILQRWIQKESHIDFIESIKENMDSIEKIRNAIMHNRSITDSELSNYMLSYSELDKKVENFRENPKNYDEDDEYWLIIWNEYELLKKLPNFKKWKKYVLKDWDWRTAIFVWEKWKEREFFDKELLEFFKIWE